MLPQGSRSLEAGHPSHIRWSRKFMLVWCCSSWCILVKMLHASTARLWCYRMLMNVIEVVVQSLILHCLVAFASGRHRGYLMIVECINCARILQKVESNGWPEPQERWFQWFPEIPCILNSSDGLRRMTSWCPKTTLTDIVDDKSPALLSIMNSECLPRFMGVPTLQVV